MQLPDPVLHQILRPLLDHLAQDKPQLGESWHDWRITRIDGGRNNLLYRATRDGHDLVCKFTIRDARDRAGREYGALMALQQAGLTIAPTPILLDRETYPLPVMVQSWLEGEVQEAPPATDAAWRALIQHLALIHSVTPDKVDICLSEATINAYSIAQGRERVQQQMAHIPVAERPTTLRSLLDRFTDLALPAWPGRVVSLIRLDNNTLNYIRRSAGWASVDWENSGWGDPAFDVANLITHPAYIGISQSRWDWAVDQYCGWVDDPGVIIRIQAHTTIMAVWWVARMARYLYEMPRGLDQRLVTWSDDWLADMHGKYEHYLRLAARLCAGWH